MASTSVYNYSLSHIPVTSLGEELDDGLVNVHLCFYRSVNGPDNAAELVQCKEIVIDPMDDFRMEEPPGSSLRVLFDELGIQDESVQGGLINELLVYFETVFLHSSDWPATIVIDILEEVGNNVVEIVTTAPASEDAIGRLEKIEAREAGTALECVICMEGEDLVEFVRMLLPCEHVFHKECAYSWLMVNGSCPLCRFQLPN